MRQRVDMLNHLWRQFSKPGSGEVEVMAIFGSDFKSRDIRNFKKICKLEFDCFIITDNTQKEFLKAGIKNPYTVVVDRVGEVIYTERGVNKRKLEAHIHRVLSK